MLKRMTAIAEFLYTAAAWGLAVLAAVMAVFTVTVLAAHRSKEIFGFRAYISLSDSMKATDFAAGDLLLVRRVDAASLQPGDIISFVSRNSASYGETVTHRIRSLTTDENGDPAFITYGTTTDTDDETPVSYANVLGRYVGRIPRVGLLLHFLRTPLGYLLGILVPFAAMILAQGVQCIRLFFEYQDEVENERVQDALAEELADELAFLLAADQERRSPAAQTT